MQCTIRLLHFFAFTLSHQPLWKKIVGVSLGLVFIFPFIIHERNASYKMYGAAQFSSMSGWQLANNALYMYGHIQVDSAQLPNSKTRELDRISKKFYSQMPSDFSHYLSTYVANFFIRQPNAPLKQYFEKNYAPEDEYNNANRLG